MSFNPGIRTYGDISYLIKHGKRIRTTSHYNNTRTYFIDEDGVARCQFNKCKPSLFYGFDVDNTSEVDKLLHIEVL